MNKFRKKLFKYLAKFAISNKLRIFFLRMAGYIIGKDVYIGEDFIVSDTLDSSKNLIIKDRVSIAPRVTIVTTSSPNNSILKKIYPIKHSIVEISEDVWIGAGVIILDGVKIGKCSIIGANSLVISDIPQYSIAYGSPAKVVSKINLKDE